MICPLFGQLTSFKPNISIANLCISDATVVSFPALYSFLIFHVAIRFIVGDLFYRLMIIRIPAPSKGCRELGAVLFPTFIVWLFLRNYNQVVSHCFPMQLTFCCEVLSEAMSYLKRKRVPWPSRR